MLGRTAGGLFWMFRYLERSENAARLLDVGFRIALTRSDATDQEWASILRTLNADSTYLQLHDDYDAKTVIDFLLRDRSHPASVMSMMAVARSNAREVRTALTREVFEATNESYLALKDLLARPVQERDLPNVLNTIRQQSALVRGALHGSMLRNDIYNFARLGTFIERADSTARILDVKYYVLLPSIAHVGAAIDNVQWETILRAVSARQAYRLLHKDKVSANGISEFLLLDSRLPRSLAFCCDVIVENLEFLARDYGERGPAQQLAVRHRDRLKNRSVQSIIEDGLHEALEDFIKSNNALTAQIETDYRFYE
jgi:uncharacterized alpha-E superfamily protein